MPHKRKPAREEVADTSSLTTKRVILIVLLTCIALGFLQGVGKSIWSRYQATPSHYNLVNLSKFVMPHDKSYREFAESREPVILIRTLVDKWLARKAFTTKFLATKLSQVSVYYQKNKRNFITFHDNKPLERLVLNEKWEDYNRMINITIEELLGWSKHHSDSSWYYFSQDISQLRSVFPDIIGYVQPINELILSEDNVQVNLWIGRAGIITSTHYDATYNFFMQLQGKKRFTLFPPDQNMYLYPCLHPHYGHSQVDILNVDLNLYPLFKDSKAFIAEVSPGDMLVVPPYWYHHVETIEESVSINIWSDAPEYALMNEIYGKPIPFEETWDWSELVLVTHMFARMIVEALDISKFDSFVCDIYTQRYHPLVIKRNIACNKTYYKQLEDVIHSVTDWTAKEQTYRPRFQKGVAEIATLFNKIPIGATINICVGNYLEHLVHRAIGLEYVCPFLCLIGTCDQTVLE